MDDFEAFFERNYGTVLRAVALAISDLPRAEDAVQEAFARALRRWRTVSRMDRPVGWVYVVALNSSRRAWRREVERDTSAINPREVEDPSRAVLTGVFVERALGTLTARQRAAVVLRYLADLSTKDVAAALGCAEGTVKATLHQALGKLRIELDDDPQEAPAP